ncbi:MAG: LLM class flavin-dependent oxidoreductase [Actinomycetota bacterium]|nr:LLM class flavin-dependent oxidoreductase [Actinomycetota bacterium]
MHVGLALPSFDFSVPGERPLRWSTVVRTAQQAERLGFDSVWLPDHLFMDLARYGGPPGEHGAIDPVVGLAALARHTRRIRLGTLVLCAPLRPATVLAKALATLDVLSGGRLIAGVGAGWYEPEFRAAGLPFAPPGARLAQLTETIQVLKGLWSGEPFSFDGAHVRAQNAYCRPRPRQHPHPPVWVGGRGDRLLGVAAAHADGWNTAWRVAPDEYRNRIRVLEGACERAGRDPGSMTLSLGLHALVGEDSADLARRFQRLRDGSPVPLGAASLDEWRRTGLAGTVDDVGEQMQAWATLGVSKLVISAGPLPFTLSSAEDVEMIAAAASLGGDAEHRTA